MHAKKTLPDASKASSALPGLAARSSEATRIPLAAGSCRSHLQGDLGTMAAERRGPRSSPGASTLHSPERSSPEGTRAKTTQGKATGQNTGQTPSSPSSEDLYIYTHTHTRSKGPRSKPQSPLGFSFIPWGQEMRTSLQLSVKGLHSPAVFSSFQKQSTGTGWQRSPGHQVLSHSQDPQREKKK